MKKYLLLTLVLSLFIGWLSCSKEKRMLQDFCGDTIISKDTSKNGELMFRFKGRFGSENTLTLSKEFDFYDTGMSVRCDTLMK